MPEIKYPFFVGFEIHKQLEEKLFCQCISTNTPTKKKAIGYLNKIEQGKITILRTNYVNKPNKCSYEIDNQEPRLNLKMANEAIIICSRILELTNEKIVTFKFRRKRILDGSIYCGFQRTALLGSNEELTIYLEEDSCSLKDKTYDLSRQGVALIEISSKKYKLENDEQLNLFISKLKNIGKFLNQNNTLRGSSSIRQDINLSISEGSRTEIKGVSSFSEIHSLIANQLERKTKLANIYEKEHTRRCIGKGLTEYLRDYTGDQRYFSEPELPVFSIALPLLEIKRRNFEAKIISLLLNNNLQEEIEKIGLKVLLKKINRESITQITIRELSNILQGKNMLSFKELKKKYNKNLSFLELQKEFSRKKINYNKYDLKYLLGLITKKEHSLTTSKGKPILLNSLILEGAKEIEPFLDEYYRLYA